MHPTTLLAETEILILNTHLISLTTFLLSQASLCALLFLSYVVIRVVLNLSLSVSSLLSLPYGMLCLSRAGTASVENNGIAMLMLSKELIKFTPFTCPGALILTLVKWK